MDEDKKENFGMKIVKKRLGFRSNSICRVEVYLLYCQKFSREENFAVSRFRDFFAKWRNLIFANIKIFGNREIYFSEILTLKTSKFQSNA